VLVQHSQGSLQRSERYKWFILAEGESGYLYRGQVPSKDQLIEKKTTSSVYRVLPVLGEKYPLGGHKCLAMGVHKTSLILLIRNG